MVREPAERLKELLDIYSLRQADFVRKIAPFSEKYRVKFNKSHLSLYLSGKVMPSVRKLSLVSKAFGVRLDWLLGCDVPMR